VPAQGARGIFKNLWGPRIKWRNFRWPVVVLGAGLYPFFWGTRPKNRPPNKPPVRVVFITCLGRFLGHEPSWGQPPICAFVCPQNPRPQWEGPPQGAFSRVIFFLGRFVPLGALLGWGGFGLSPQCLPPLTSLGKWGFFFWPLFGGNIGPLTQGPPLAWPLKMKVLFRSPSPGFLGAAFGLLVWVIF